MNDRGPAGLLETKQACAWLEEELGEGYRMTPRRFLQLSEREEEPLPIAIRGARGRSHLFDKDQILEWFEREVDRQSQNPETSFISLTEGIQLTLSAFAREIGRHHQTVARIVSDWDVKPVANRPTPGGSTDYYRLRDLLQAITSENVAQDPQSLPPLERRAHYQAEQARLNVEKEQGRLLDIQDVRLEYARMAKIMDAACDTLLEMLERTFRFPPDQMELAEKRIDGVRAELVACLEAPLLADPPLDAAA